MPVQNHDPEAQGRLLLELASRVTGTLDLQIVLDESLAALRQLVDFGGGAIQLIEDGHLVAAATDPPMSPEARTVRIPVGVGISGGIAATGKADYVPDITLDERIPEAARKNGVSGGVRSYYGAPLIMNGKPIGVVQIDAPQVDAFDAATRGMLLAFMPTISAAVQNARMFEQEREVSRRLTETTRLKSDFVSIVSHELRTPLTIMLGMSGTLATRAEQLTSDQVRQFATRTNSAARRLRRLIDDLLYAGNLDRGFLAVHPVATSLQATLDVVRAEHGLGVHPIEFDVPADLPMAWSDPDRLLQVVTNLVVNAEKYSPDGTTILVRARSEGHLITLEVTDEGPGIDPAKREAIFDLFYQAEDIDTRQEGGLGIGLWVVKRLCNAMGATIDVEDAETGGTCFRITLLTADAPDARAATTPTPPAEAGHEAMQ